MAEEWSEPQTDQKAKEKAAAGDNTLTYPLQSGYIHEVLSVEVGNSSRAFLGAYVWTVDGGPDVTTSRHGIGLVNGVLLPQSSGGGSLLWHGKQYARKAIVAVIKDCTLNDGLIMKVQFRSKRLKR